MEKRHLERLSGFHMAQVNCLAQGGTALVIATGLSADPCQIYATQMVSSSVSALRLSTCTSLTCPDPQLVL
jgi:hypothetical protein